MKKQHKKLISRTGSTRIKSLPLLRGMFICPEVIKKWNWDPAMALDLDPSIRIRFKEQMQDQY